MSHLYFPTEILECFCIDSFKNFGFSEDESKIITDVLLTSDKFGIESHGMQRISRYHKGIQKGLIKVDAVPEVIFETPVTAVLDAHDGMGQLVAYKAMNMAIMELQDIMQKWQVMKGLWECPVPIQRRSWFLHLGKKQCLEAIL